MTLRTFLLGVVLVSSACGKKAEEAKPSPAPAPAPAASTKEPAGSAATAPKSAEPPAEQAPPIAEPTGMFACKNKEGAPAAATKPDPKNPWAMPFTPGPCPSVPPMFGTATFDMELAAAAKAMKGSKVDGGSVYLYVGKRPFALQTVARANEATGKIEEFGFKVDEVGFAAFKAAWGEPAPLKSLGDEGFAWFDPATKIRLTARPDGWDRADPKTKEDVEVPGFRVNVERYLPLADLLSADGLLGKPMLGKTVEEIATAYPQWLEVKTAEQAKAELDKVVTDQDAKAKALALGAGGASANLQLPPTETQPHHVLVQPDWRDGKMEAYSFSIPYEKNEKVKAEILGTVAAALGKPTASVKKDKDWKYTFKGHGDTVVTLQVGMMDDDWRLDVRAKDAK